MKNILIISNNCISNSESNGRIHGYFLKDYILGKHIHNFYLRGSNDIPHVQYIRTRNINVFINKLSFGLNKIALFKNNCSERASLSKKSFLSKFVLFHLLRNYAFTNKRIITELKQYVKSNDIKAIQVWGSNIPFLYWYGYELSKQCEIPLTIFTGEDYPLKKYNFINSFSPLFNSYLKKLYNEAKKAYEHSSCNLFATNDLLNLYTQSYNSKNNFVINFSSEFDKKDFKFEMSKNIFYGGNLYGGRCDSLIQIAYAIKDYDIKIDVYGYGEKKELERLKQCPKINYCGNLDYNNLKTKIKEHKILLHVEGFDKNYINDCKYAFSSKISDYLVTGKPLFFYGPQEISGIKEMHLINSNCVATSKLELYKLFNLIKSPIAFAQDNVVDSFKVKTVSAVMKDVIEKTE